MPRPRPRGPGPQGPPTLANAPQYFQGVRNDIRNTVSGLTDQLGSMGSSLFPQTQGRPRPRVVKGKEDPGFQTTPVGNSGGDVGQQSFGTYAPDIDTNQFKPENFNRGLKEVSSLGYGGGSGFSGMMGMMGGLDPNMLMALLGQLGGGGMGGGPLVGR